MRYSRQELYRNIGKEGQKKLRQSTVTFVGVGAVGSVSSELLCRAGIGKLILIDRDVVEESNLPRQALFTEKDIGMPKAIAAQERLHAINKGAKIKAYVEDLDYRNIDKLVEGSLVLDGTDNLETRFLLNDYCLRNRIKWIYAGAIKDYGNVMNIIPGNVCFRCIFKEGSALETCDTAGVLNTIIYTISSIQATQAIKILLNKDYSKALIRFNVWDSSLQNIKVEKDIHCPACKGRYEYLEGKKGSDAVKLCGQNSFQLKGGIKDLRIDLKELAKRLKRLGKARITPYYLNFGNLTVFSDGRALIKAKNETEARILYSRYIGN